MATAAAPRPRLAAVLVTVLVVLLVPCVCGQQPTRSDDDTLPRARQIIRLDEAAIPNKFRARPAPQHEIKTTIEGARAAGEAAETEAHAPFGQCRLDIDILWRNDVGSGVISSPLVADVESMFENQVIVGAHRYYVELLDGDDGHPMPGWPYIADRQQFLASPILVDIDHDGIEEVLMATKSGELLLFTPSGERLLAHSFHLPKLPVHTDWADGIDSANASATFSLFDHRVGEPFSGQTPYSNLYYDDYYYGFPEHEQGGGATPTKPPYVNLDPHVLATPILHDFNEDGKAELIVPVTYYFDPELYSDPIKRDKLGDVDITKYAACSILILDLSEAQVIEGHALDLTTVRSDWPAYIVASPTVADLDGDGGMDIIVGTSVGFVYAINQNGAIMPGFPITMDEVHTQILVADLFNNRKMHVIVADRSGNIAAYNAEAGEVWETQVKGYPPEALALGDLNADGVLEIVVGTSEGLLYVINAQTGQFAPNYPIRLSKEPIRAPPTLVALEKTNRTLTIIVPSIDGLLHLIHPSGCIDRIDLGTRVYSRIMADNVSNRGKMDLVLASADGEVICLSTEAAYHPLKSTPPVSVSPTPYRFGYCGIYALDETRQLMHVTGHTFIVRFEIYDQRPVTTHESYIPVYQVKIYASGSRLLFSGTYHTAGVKTESITAPRDRFVGTVRLEMVNELHEVFYDSFTLGFNIYFYRTLKWLVAAPLACLAFVLTFARHLDLPDLPVWRS